MRIRKLSERRDDGGFEGRIEDAYFLNANGERHTGAGGIPQLFLCIDQEVVLKETETEVLQSFVIEDDKQGQLAHRALVMLLNVFGKETGPPVWRQVMMREKLPLPIGPQQAAQNALDAGFIQHIFVWHPVTHPDFLDKIAAPAITPTPRPTE